MQGTQIASSARPLALARIPLDSSALFIVGRSGVGKHLYALVHISERLAAGQAVVVIDMGQSYRKAAAALGGTFIELVADGGHTETVHGETPLFVYEIEGLCGGLNQWCAALPQPTVGRRLSFGDLLVVDETAFVTKHFPALYTTVNDAVEIGASVCITGQHDEDVAAFGRLGVPTRTLRLSIDS